MCQSSVHACIKIMLENLKIDILLFNILVSLHVGMLNPIHASLKLVFQSPSFIDQSLPIIVCSHGIF